MASFPNIRVNRVNAQTVASNFYQGSSADITNVSCDNLTVDNLISDSATFTGDVNISSTTQSTSSTTGALVVAGGVGIGKNLNVGENVGITGCVDIFNLTDTNLLIGNTGALVVLGACLLIKVYMLVETKI